MSQTKSANYGYVSDKTALIKRLHRIEGQVRGIERMVEEERYCIDILTQISAVTTALDTLGLKILGDHVNSCVAHAFASLTDFPSTSSCGNGKLPSAIIAAVPNEYSSAPRRAAISTSRPVRRPPSMRTRIRSRSPLSMRAR